MLHGEDGVLEEHPSARVCHHFLDLVSLPDLVAVDLTGAALWLDFVGTFFQTELCVLKEFPAFVTKAFFGPVVTLAVNLDHLAYCFDLCVYIFFHFPATFAQESRRDTTRLNRGFPGRESLASTQK